MHVLAVVVVALVPIAVASCGGRDGGEDSRSDGNVSAGAGVTGGDFHSLVADPVVPGRLYVGGHTNVSRSDDGGKTWTSVAALDDADAMGWAIGPDAIWVSGHPGVNVSIDGGASFTRRNSGLPDTDVHAFGASGATLYAAGPRIGVAFSADSGASWERLTSNAGQAFFGRILIDPDDPSHLVAADVQRGASVSRDGGRSWAPVGSGAAWVSSADGLDTLYASGGPAPERSRDGGATWEPVEVPAGATLIEAAAGGVVYAGAHDGQVVSVWVSHDDGASWARP